MKRHLMMVALAGLIGGALLTSDAAACCHKKKKAECEPVAYAAPCPPPAPVCEPCAAPKKKCGLFSKMFHKKKATCAPVACDTCAAPVAYSAPYYAPAMPTGQSMGSGQYIGSGQSY